MKLNSPILFGLILIVCSSAVCADSIKVEVNSNKCVELFNASDNQLLPGNTSASGINAGSYSTACYPNEGSTFPVSMSASGDFEIIAGDPESDIWYGDSKHSYKIRCFVLDVKKVVVLNANFFDIGGGGAAQTNEISWLPKTDNVICFLA